MIASILQSMIKCFIYLQQNTGACPRFLSAVSPSLLTFLQNNNVLAIKLLSLSLVGVVWICCWTATTRNWATRSTASRAISTNRKITSSSGHRTRPGPWARRLLQRQAMLATRRTHRPRLIANGSGKATVGCFPAAHAVIASSQTHFSCFSFFRSVVLPLFSIFIDNISQTGGMCWKLGNHWAVHQIVWRGSGATNFPSHHACFQRRRRLRGNRWSN